MTLQVAERIICAGRRHDDRGNAVGPVCARRAHPGCVVCDHDNPVFVEKHAADIAELCRVAGWKLGEPDESGRYPRAMCRLCARPAAGAVRLVEGL